MDKLVEYLEALDRQSSVVFHTRVLQGLTLHVRDLIHQYREETSDFKELLEQLSGINEICHTLTDYLSQTLAGQPTWSVKDLALRLVRISNNYGISERVGYTIAYAWKRQAEEDQNSVPDADAPH